jgi:hypothetical protein
MSDPLDPRLHFSGRPADDRPPPEATVRLGDGLSAAAGPDDPATEGPATEGPAIEGPAAEETRATVLDPASWSSEVTAVAPAEPDATRATGVTGTTGALRRFGPGVPVPEASAGTSQTAAVWHGTLRPGSDAVPPGAGGARRRRALRGWLLPLVVLLAVLAYLAWQRFPASVRVEGVAVRGAAAVQGCHSTARVVGTLRTSGGAGTVRYRWLRSDGTTSGELKQHVAKGHRSTDVVLLWSFDGRGSLTATATLEVLAPQHRVGAATFTYRCG